MRKSIINTLQAGYTLIELAIVVAVVGLALATAAPIYNMHIQEKATQETKVNITVIQDALASYLKTSAKYPCPAPLDASWQDADYGMETDCEDTSVAIGNCANGICIEESAVEAGVRVRRGAIPFRVLNLPETAAYDGYDNKLMYALTERLAVETTYAPDKGGISVVDGSTPPKSLVEPDGSVHFVVFSVGKDGKGAYTREGVLKQACAGGVDSKNCSTSLADEEAVYVSVAHNASGSAEHFDDEMAYYTSLDRPLWKKTSSNTLNIQDLSFGGMLKFGSDITGADASDPVTLRVEGDVRATGNLHATEICDLNGNNCFSPTKVGGEHPDMKCPPGEYAVEVKNGKLICNNNVSMGCPPGERMTGIDGDGLPVCEEPKNKCPVKSYTECGETKTVPESIHGTDITLSFGDPTVSNRQKRIECNNGTWYHHNTWGDCTCTPDNYTYEDTTGVCAYGLDVVTGAIMEYNRTCPGNVVTRTEITPAVCSCTPKTQGPEVSSCPPGHTGEIKKQRDLVCNTASTGTWTGWYEISNTCTCAPQTTTTPMTCPSGFTGTKTKEVSTVCPSGNTVENIIDNCVCDSSYSTTKTVACAPGEIGTRKEKWIMDCSTGTAVFDSVIEDTCRQAECSWVEVSSSTGITEQPGQSFMSGASCTCGSENRGCFRPAGDGQFRNYPTCECQITN